MCFYKENSHDVLFRSLLLLCFPMIFGWCFITSTEICLLDSYCRKVTVISLYSFCRYELVQADLAVASFSELSVINLRRLFAHKGSSFMDLQKQIIEKSPPKRKLMTDTIY